MLANFIKSVITQNELLDGHYVELYAGGAGIAWPLLFEEYVSCVYINDINKAIFAFWKCVTEKPDELCKLISDTPVNIREWRRQKNILANPENHSTLDLGFSAFFLNRTNRSGIIKGGVIGGKSQTGKWKLDARFNKPDLIYRIQRIARYAGRIKISNQDAANFITEILPNLPRKTLIYLDPPYYIKGQGLYENHYIHPDHVQISKLMSNNVHVPWIVSYDNTPKIIELYKGFQRITYGLSYSAQDRYSGSEVMFFSNQLNIPMVEDPTKVKLPLQIALQA